MMITSHTSTQSYVNNGVHLLRFVSGAEGFVFLAGLVLGMVYRRKLECRTRCVVLSRDLEASRMLWMVHCALTLAAVILNPILFHYADHPGRAAIVSVARSMAYRYASASTPATCLTFCHCNVFPLMRSSAVLRADEAWKDCLAPGRLTGPIRLLPV